MPQLKTLTMITYDTVTEALNNLKQQGYTTDFNLAFDKLKCAETGICLSPSQFEIVDHFRFEGMTNPADAAILYVIRSKDGTMKGTLVSAYGTYSEPISEEMIRRLEMHHYQ
jgi:hypothetical protein